MKATFTRHSDGTCTFKFAHLTQGKALALAHALKAHAEGGSLVAEDIVCAAGKAVQENTSFLKHTDIDQQLYEAFVKLYSDA